jgi:tetratricopeptide (TPR) repeat protein
MEHIKTILLLILCLCGNVLFAQELVYEDITEIVTKDDVLPRRCMIGKSDACVTIIADKSLNLDFRSNVENKEEFYHNQANISDKIHYYLHFKMDNAHRNRKLEVFSKLTPLPLVIYLNELLFPDVAVFYSVDVVRCFDALFQTGNKLFAAGEYLSAKAKYEEAQNCFDKSLDGELEKKIVQMDSMIAWQNTADRNFLLLDYQNAYVYYNKIYSANQNDEKNVKKMRLTSIKNNEFCKKYIQQAGKYYYTQEYEKALIMYEKLTNGDCFYKDSAVNMVKKVEKAISARNDKRGVFTYEFGFSNHLEFKLPIGFQIGSYNTKKAGFYWSVFANPEIFETFRNNYPKTINGNIGTTMGFTFRPISRKPKYDKVPIWLHLGAGYSLMSHYQHKNESGSIVDYNGGNIENIDLTFKPYHIVPFEAGMTVKIWDFVLRYTFQYRFATYTKAQDYIYPDIHKVGIGFCW